MTPESVLPGTGCLECSKPSPGLILRGATVWASASSSYDRRSEFWDTALRSLPLPVAGPAFLFLRAKPKEVNERHLSQHRSNAKTHGNDEWQVLPTVSIALDFNSPRQ